MYIYLLYCVIIHLNVLMKKCVIQPIIGNISKLIYIVLLNHINNISVSLDIRCLQININDKNIRTLNLKRS